MSKRPLSPPLAITIPPECLDFEAWQSQEHGTASTSRHDDTVYDPSIESLPDHEWYSLDDQALHEKLVQMCNDLGGPVVNCKIDDPEIADLLRALDRAKSVPRPKKVNIAVVGNQGVGKSSTINALLNRDLVDASASSSACTAFATIIEHKDGAADDTTVSDLKVTFLDTEEMRDFIEEHVRRYADVYTPTEGEHKSDEEKEVEIGTITEEQETPPDMDPEDAISEADILDSDFSDASESAVGKKKKRKKMSKALQLGADTAEQFFRIIFNAHLNKTKEAELQEWLNTPDLEDGEFLEHCVTAATEHLAKIHADEGGRLEYTHVEDIDLQKVRNHATQLWPLVKAVTISTGSSLLRNGIRFMDLPGITLLQHLLTVSYANNRQDTEISTRPDQRLSTSIVARQTSKW